jgi:rhodanese-related sulfurtransferase
VSRLRHALLALALIAPATALGKPAPRVPAPVALAPVEVQALQQRGSALLVDVREREELREVIDGAQWTPTSQLEQPPGWAAFVHALPRKKTIVFFCVAGVRARAAAERLYQAGFAAAWFEGPAQWKAAGLPIKPGPAGAGPPPAKTTR